MSRRASWVYAAAFAVLGMLLTASLLVVPYLPTNDGPEHVLAAHIEDHYGDAGTLYRDTLVPASEYASRGFSLLFGPLGASLGWERGLRVSLVVTALLSAFGFLALVRSVEPRRMGVAFLGFPLALTWELYMGFFPFSVGSAIGLFVLALAVAWRPPSRAQRVLLGFLLLLQAVCHVFSATLTGGVIALLFIVRAPPGRRAREALWVTIMGLPAACVLLAAVVLGRSLTRSPFSEEFLLLPPSTTLAIVPRLIAPGPWWRAVVVSALLLGGIVVAAWRVRRAETSASDRALSIAGAALLLLTVLAPLHVPGWQFFSPRFAPLGALLCLASLPIERAPRQAVTLSGAFFAAALASLLVSFGLHHRLAASALDAVAGLAAPVTRHGFWLPVTLAPEGTLPFDPTVSEVPFLSPLRHIPSLYAVAEGGLTPYTFANNAATYPFVVREDGVRSPPIPSIAEYAPQIESDAFASDPQLRRRVQDELATYGMFYEGVLVTEARPADITLWRTRGYAPDWQGGTVFIGHFVPCAVDVDVAATGDLPSIDVGVGRQTILRNETPAPAVGSDGRRHLVLAKAPCGDVWVRPHWDGPGPRYCGNASPTGELHATVTAGSGLVRCDDPP